MRLSPDNALKPARKLRKMLKDFPRDPSPEEVHSLRTQTRRLEASVRALWPENDRKARRLLKAMKPLRKAAGKVRDMDVLIGKVLALRVDPNRECLVKLMEELTAERSKDVKYLGRIIQTDEIRSRKLLKKYVQRVKQVTDPPDPQVSAARAEDLASELDRWPKLNARNLHKFRLRAKELRYVLQLTPDANPRGMESFGRVKDAAGEWHDWLELSNLAQRLLDGENDCAVLQTIRRTTQDKLRAALNAANALRREGSRKLAVM